MYFKEKLVAKYVIMCYNWNQKLDLTSKRR